MTTEIFLDLENIGISFGVPRSVDKFNFIASGLSRELVLQPEVFEIVSATGVASDRRAIENLPHKIKGELAQVARRHGWQIVWSHGIADTTIIGMIERKLATGTLAESVTLIGNDHDFCKIIRSVTATGRSAFVIGTEVSNRLKRVATRSVNLWELLGEDYSLRDWQTHVAARTPKSVFNAINIAGFDQQAAL